MEIKDMNIEQVEERKAQLTKDMEVDGADLNAIEEEMRALNERKDAIKAEVEARAKVVDEVINAPIATPIVEERNMEKVYDATSKEYRNAFLKNLMGLELTDEERTAYTHTTVNTSAVIPTTMLNEIWDKIEAHHSILGDIRIFKTGTVLEIPVRTSIDAGDAKVVNENAANDDEKNTFTKVTLSGKDFAKDVEISYALGTMSIDGFEAYLINEIADRMAHALAEDTFAQIKSDMNVDNAIEAETLTWAEVTRLFSLVENAGTLTVYAKRSTIYKHLAGMTDSTGRPIFQPSAQAGVEGYLLGAAVKVDDGAGDDMLFVGDGQKVAMNMLQDIMVEKDKDIKKHVHIYSGYCRAESKLVMDKAFASLNLNPAESE